VLHIQPLASFAGNGILPVAFAASHLLDIFLVLVLVVVVVVVLLSYHLFMYSHDNYTAHLDTRNGLLPVTSTAAS
jgi:membrane protein YdbS with pleckstrin-like domain